jgi:hypothetical protein
MAYQIAAASKLRLRSLLGRSAADDMASVERTIRLQLGL